MKIKYLGWALFACLFVGCNNGTTNKEEHEHEGEAAHSNKHPGEISYSPAQQKAVGLQTVKVALAPFTEVIRTSGRIMPAQGSESVVVAKVPGIVKTGSLSWVEGTVVHKGQALLTLVSNDLAGGDIASRARVTFETAKKEFERAGSLVADKIISQREYEQAKQDYENARIAYQAVSGKQTKNGGIAVTAPLSGFLKDIRVSAGDYVDVGQTLATISENNRLVLKADVSEKYFDQLSLIKSANFRMPYSDKVYQLSELNGHLLSYGKAADEESFYIPVTFGFDNKGSIIPGSFVETWLLSSPIDNVISVPLNAVIEEQSVTSVFVRIDEDCFRKQFVTLGPNNGVSVQVLSGLKVGDEVVTDGAYQLKLASASNAIPAHTHHH